MEGLAEKSAFIFDPRDYFRGKPVVRRVKPKDREHPATGKRVERPQNGWTTKADDGRPVTARHWRGRKRVHKNRYYIVHLVPPRKGGMLAKAFPKIDESKDYFAGGGINTGTEWRGLFSSIGE